MHDENDTDEELLAPELSGEERAMDTALRPKKLEEFVGQKKLRENLDRDRLLQYTTHGIHKDDLSMEIQGYPIKKFGSQGQQKSFLIALKFAISAALIAVLAVNFGYRKDRAKTAILLLVTAAFGASFVGMQAFEWTKLIVEEGVRPWGNPFGAAQFGSIFFMITGFHGFHVSVGVLFLFITARKVWRGDYDNETPGFFTSRKGSYESVEVMGLYWHFVDLVWVFIFAFFYLW